MSSAVPFPGKVRWRITSLFSGIECFREALCILDSAVAEQFGFRLDIKYALMVTWLRFRLGLKLLDDQHVVSTSHMLFEGNWIKM